jgi:hypothetical protein
MTMPVLPSTHTAQILAKALRECGLNEMAEKAAVGYYHDFLSPLDMPELALVGDLLDEAVIARNNGAINRYNAIVKLRLEVIEGKHDASHAESDAWASSPEGQIALRTLWGASRAKN